MQKPIQHTYFSYQEMKKYISAKYNVDLDSFRGNGRHRFWNFLLDYLGDDTIVDRVVINLSWGDVLDAAEEEWQKEIAQMFVDEFGEDYMDIMISW